VKDMPDRPAFIEALQAVSIDILPSVEKLLWTWQSNITLPPDFICTILTRNNINFKQTNLAKELFLNYLFYMGKHKQVTFTSRCKWNIISL